MPSIIAHRVFSDLVTIAQSRAIPLDRQARMSQCLEQFRIDLAKSRHQDAAVGSILAKLRAGLEVAANSPALRPDQRSVLDDALRTLSELGRKQSVAPPTMAKLRAQGDGS